MWTEAGCPSADVLSTIKRHAKKRFHVLWCLCLLYFSFFFFLYCTFTGVYNNNNNNNNNNNMIDDRSHTYLIKRLPPEVKVILRRSRHASRDKMYPAFSPPKILPRVIKTYGACARGGGRRPGFEARLATYLARGGGAFY